MLNLIAKPARRVAAGLASVLALGFAGQAMAEPALWAIKDHDSTIYLFGTVHVLKPGTQWRSPRIDGALKSAGDLTIEIVGGDDPAVMQPLIIKYGVDQTTPLSQKLAPADLKEAQDLAQSMGIPVAALEKMRPWLASLSFSMLPIMKSGYDPKSGVEQVLQTEAKTSGKAVAAFETPEQQIRFFADLPVSTEVEMLKSTMDDVEEGPAKLDKLVTAWAAGDQKVLETEFVTEMKTEHPAAYEALLVKRNQDWAKQLKTKLDGKGVSFVAVGAAHLVGPDSVQAQLAKVGVKAEVVK